MTRNTTAGDENPRRTPAIVGAANTLMPAIHPDATLVAVSSAGERARAGANDECSGRVSVNETVAGIRSAYTTMFGPPKASATPPTPQATACTRYAATSARPGG